MGLFDSIGSSLSHGLGDVERGFGNWNGQHTSGDWLEKAGRVAGAVTHPQTVFGDANHNLEHPVQTWDHMGSVQKDIVKGAGAVGLAGLAVATGGAALGALGGGGAAAAGEGAAAAGEAAAGEGAASAGEAAAARGGIGGIIRSGLTPRALGRAFVSHEAIQGLTGGQGVAGATGMAGGGTSNYEAQAVAHQQLGALNASQFG